MLFHYALVDDLITKEEFERRVEEKIEACGDLIDEPTAAMMVVGDLGRQHVKIRGLSAKSSLFSFFGKVVDKTDPKEFNRADGEKGWVATLLLGDETGSTRVVLWDEKAGAVLEIQAGDVLEIIGRHPGKNTKEIYALALRKASCEIECIVSQQNGSGNLSNEPVELDAVLLGVGEIRTFSKRDGTPGEMLDAVIGDPAGTARVVTWKPEILTAIPIGSSLHITGAKPDRRNEGRAYSLDEKSTVSPTEKEIKIPFTQIGSVTDQGVYSVRGEIKELKDPRSFSMKSGGSSWVRNIIVTDSTGTIRVVLWGENALLSLQPGDVIEVFHAAAKAGKFGGTELGVGRGSVLKVPGRESTPITFTGTIIAGNGCLFIDNGQERYVLDADLPHGGRFEVTGLLSGNLIVPERVTPAEIDAEALLKKIQNFRESLKG